MSVHRNTAIFQQFVKGELKTTRRAVSTNDPKDLKLPPGTYSVQIVVNKVPILKRHHPRYKGRTVGTAPVYYVEKNVEIYTRDNYPHDNEQVIRMLFPTGSVSMAFPKVALLPNGEVHLIQENRILKAG